MFILVHYESQVRSRFTFGASHHCSTRDTFVSQAVKITVIVPVEEIVNSVAIEFERAYKGLTPADWISSGHVEEVCRVYVPFQCHKHVSSASEV